MTTGVTWPKDIGDPVSPATNYSTLFNTTNNMTTAFSRSFESLGNDNTTTGNLTKWCLSSSTFGDFFPAAEVAKKTNLTMVVNVIMDDLRDGTCVDKNFDQVVFCDLLNHCTDYPPSITLMGASSSSSSSMGLYIGIGIGAVVVVAIGVFAIMKGCKGGSDTSGYE